jgi:hypothetical protein
MNVQNLPAMVGIHSHDVGKSPLAQIIGNSLCR